MESPTPPPRNPADPVLSPQDGVTPVATTHREVPIVAVWRRRWFQVLLGALVIFWVLSYVVPGVLDVLDAVKSVLLPVLIGLALAYLCNPLLRFLERKARIGRLAGTICVMLLALVIIAATLPPALMLAYEQASQLVKTVQESYPKYVDQLLSRLDAEGSVGASVVEAVTQEAPPQEAADAPDTTAEAIEEAAEMSEASATNPPDPAAQNGGDIDVEVSVPGSGTQPQATVTAEPGGERGETKIETKTPTADVTVETDTPPSTTPAGDPAEGDVAVEVDTPGATVEAGDEAEEPQGFLTPFEEVIDRNRRLMAVGLGRLKGLDWQQVYAWVTASLGVGVGIVGTAISFTMYVVLCAVVIGFCFFFFSWKFDAILAWFVPFIPLSHRERTLDMMHKMDMAVSSFVRGRVIQTGVMMMVLCVGWWWAGVPYWFILGVLTGLLNLIPFLPVVGWVVAVVLTVMTALANGETFVFGLILWPTVMYLVAQFFDGWVVEPFVQGKATNLDPLTVLLVVLIGGSVAGLLGMLLAIPLAACTKIVCKEWVVPELRKIAAEN